MIPTATFTPAATISRQQRGHSYWHTVKCKLMHTKLNLTASERAERKSDPLDSQSAIVPIPYWIIDHKYRDQSKQQTGV
jgi:hypothetical protein